MKNYKLNFKSDNNIYFFKENEFKLKCEQLKSIGFYEEYHNFYSKSYQYSESPYDWIHIIIVADNEFIGLKLGSNIHLPCLVNKNSMDKKKYSNILKVTREDIVKLKGFGIIK